MKNTIEIAFKKLLGKGRAFKTPAGFMSDFLDLLVSPFSDLKTRFLNLKFTHFPTVNVDENGGEVDLDYTIELNNSLPTHNGLHLKIRKVGNQE